jgi:hypothetical protein
VDVCVFIVVVSPFLQYYYNSQTQQYLYWDSEKQTYVPASAADQTEQSANASAAASNEAKESKERKQEKPKSKTAQQVGRGISRQHNFRLVIIVCSLFKCICLRGGNWFCSRGAHKT